MKFQNIFAGIAGILCGKNVKNKLKVRKQSKS